MALLFIDGFDHYGNGANPVSFGKWGFTDYLPGNTKNDRVRTGTHSHYFGGVSDNMITKPLTASGGVIVGVAVNGNAPWSTGGNLIEIREGTTIHLAIGITVDGKLTVKLGGSTVLATGASALAATNWYYVEFKAIIADGTGGSYDLRVDGVPELTASGIDTRNGGTTGQWDRIRIAGIVGSNGTYLDDFYVCDTSGAAPYNTFLGLVKIETLYPQTDATAAGSNAGLTPSTGTDHGALVDETAPNSADYNSTSTVGVKDTYNYPPMTLTGVILGVQTNLYCNKSDAAARSVCAVVRSGGVDYDGANVSPLTTFSYLTTPFALNPNTSTPWTAATIAAIEVGMKVTV